MSDETKKTEQGEASAKQQENEQLKDKLREMGVMPGEQDNPRMDENKDKRRGGAMLLGAVVAVAIILVLWFSGGDEVNMDRETADAGAASAADDASSPGSATGAYAQQGTMAYQGGAPGQGAGPRPYQGAGQAYSAAQGAGSGDAAGGAAEGAGTQDGMRTSATQRGPWHGPYPHPGYAYAPRPQPWGAPPGWRTVPSGAPLAQQRSAAAVPQAQAGVETQRVPGYWSHPRPYYPPRRPYGSAFYGYGAFYYAPRPAYYGYRPPYGYPPRHYAWGPNAPSQAQGAEE